MPKKRTKAADNHAKTLQEANAEALASIPLRPLTSEASTGRAWIPPQPPDTSSDLGLPESHLEGLAKQSDRPLPISRPSRSETERAYLFQDYILHGGQALGAPANEPYGVWDAQRGFRTSEEIRAAEAQRQEQQRVEADRYPICDIRSLRRG